MNNTTRKLISTFGALVGVMGIEHGVGEILQGNTAPSGLIFPSWPGSDFFEILAGEPAMSVIPNLLVSGMLAVLVSLAFIVWVVWFVQRKHAGLVMMLLSVLMLLVGGGIFPPVFGMLLGAAAAWIHSPLHWWRAHLTGGLHRLLADLWPWLFGAGLLAWAVMFPGVPVMNYFFGVDSETLIWAILGCMFGFLFLAVLASFARDSRGQSV